MPYRQIIFAFLALAVLSSCDENRIFEKHSSAFPQFRWQQGQELSFSPAIDDTTATYRITLALRHVNGFQFAELKANMVVTSPSGNEQTMDYTIPVMDGKGGYLSECALDLCDLEHVIAANWQFAESGTYTFRVDHDMPVETLPNVMEVGLIIDKQK